MLISKLIKTNNLIKQKWMINTTTSVFRRHQTTNVATNTSKLSYNSKPAGGFHLIGQTIQERLDSIVLRKPNELAYRFFPSKVSYTFLELKQRVDELAQSYMQLGLQKGDRVALMLPNMPELMLTMLALAQIGCISVMMNPAYQSSEVEYMLKKTRAKGIVILDNFRILKHYELLNRICPELRQCGKGELKSTNLVDLKHVILVKNCLISDNSVKYDGTWSFNEDIVKLSGRRETPKLDFDDPVSLLFTSGTTGTPKAVPLTHFAMINTTHIEAYLGSSEANRIACIPIPMFHIFGYIVGCLSPIVNGTRTIFPSFFPDTPSTMRAIESERCTALKGSTVIFLDLINHPDLRKHDLTSLQHILFGGAVVPKDIILKIKNTLNLKSAHIAWGMTEITSSGTCTVDGDLLKSEAHAFETIGTAMPYTETKIVDPKTGELVERNKDGEICIRSYGVIKGYWEDPEKTAEIIDKNGWLKTGDIGCMTDDGYLVYKSRIKEMINRGGINVYPAEIERLLRSHPSILDCCVFSMPDERLGEEIAAWVKLKPGCEAVSVKDVREFASQHIAAFKIPKYVRCVDGFPTSATGKVQKFKMTQLMSEFIKENK